MGTREDSTEKGGCLELAQDCAKMQALILVVLDLCVVMSEC
jgi:hypothetical protein